MARHFLPDVFGRGSGNDMFSNLQREIDRVFQDFGRGGMPSLGELGRGGMGMKVNVAEQDGALEVTAELPGCAPEDIDVQLKDGVLTIKGEKKVEKDEKEKGYHLMERSYGMFERSFSLPAEVDGSKVEASFDKGVLKVVLPKLPQEQSKSQKITVKPSG
ncbi:Hsp20/alpha crystallin family protein [Aestuariivirga sp.]|uniref:Hsp20/alpha crystallin family protein n=1 Tax=Aestuariivirga sp. TaxID=2650926 RepID=UPI00391D7018